ncbi:hypothetical protein LJR030_005146 [Rhizobium sp. LjRoot30]|uniref:hypothetical protein n=1 Tax=Rhizobium sp. LjRoot30 TaxID=3342320 RepID=UPI003ECC27A7
MIFIFLIRSGLGEFTFARVFYIQKRAGQRALRLALQITRPYVRVNHLKAFFAAFTNVHSLWRQAKEA